MNPAVAEEFHHVPAPAALARTRTADLRIKQNNFFDVFKIIFKPVVEKKGPAGGPADTEIEDPHTFIMLGLLNQWLFWGISYLACPGPKLRDFISEKSELHSTASTLLFCFRLTVHQLRRPLGMPGRTGHYTSPWCSEEGLRHRPKPFPFL